MCAPQYDNGDCCDFIGELFSNVPESTGLYMLLWTNPGKKSTWVRRNDGEEFMFAGDYAAKMAQKANVYIGCGLSPQDYGPKKRCKADSIAGITALWIDLDYGKDGQNGKVYPPTIEDAQSIIAAMPVAPTMVVHTGNGLHLWYCLREAWIFESDAERAKAAALVESWQRLAQAAAKRLGGWDIDATHDLTRVLRVAGTNNVKDRSNPKPVRVIERDTMRRYNPDELADMARDHMPQEIETEPSPIVESHCQTAPLAIDPADGWAWINRMCEIDDKILLAWRAQLKDLGDTSLSGQIASFCCQVYTDNVQEQNLRFAIIEFYKARGQDEIKRKKGYRKDIQDGIISGARKLYLERQARENLQRYNEKIRESAAEGGKEAAKATAREAAPKMFELLTKQIGCKVYGVKKYLTQPSTYVLESNHGAIDLGTTRNLMSRRDFVERLSDAMDCFVELKKDQHKEIVDSILRVAEHVELGPEATDEGILRGHVQRYIETKAILADAEAAMEDGFNRPLWYNGRVCFRLDKLQEHLTMIRFRHEPAKLPGLLKKVGFDRIGVKVTDDNGRKTERSCWACPVDMCFDQAAIRHAAGNPWNATIVDQ